VQGAVVVAADVAFPAMEVARTARPQIAVVGRVLVIAQYHIIAERNTALWLLVTAVRVRLLPQIRFSS
jgi:hypothetical protein